MPEAISVLRKCIIEEYLSNWFTYEELGLSRNVVQRNLTTRLKKISKEKYEQVKQRLEANQLRVLEEHGFKKYG
ncbi:MAG: sporulation transcriptional regulator SpoIIID [Bacilli bacterium]|nr:sporulation transcriptional regulator SpoIIID [Bacilli bacterium]